MANKIVVTGGVTEFEFVRMSPPPYALSEQMEYSVRTGVDGFAFWKTGFRGRHFSVLTLADFSTLALAYFTFQQGYVKAITRPVEVRWEDAHVNITIDAVVDNVSYAGRGCYSPAVTLGGLVGNLNVGGGICMAQWDLVSTGENTI